MRSHFHDSHAVADDHRDVAVPDREVDRQRRIRHERRAQSGLLCCEKCWPRWRSALSLVLIPRIDHRGDVYRQPPPVADSPSG